jgi:hypothetical protein
MILRQLLDEHKKSSQEKDETVETEKEVDTVRSGSEEEEIEASEEKLKRSSHF